MSAAIHSVLTVLGVLVGLLALAAGLTFIERRLLGLLQERWGPNRAGPFGLLQLVADAVKILTKEDWIAPFSDRVVFFLAPAIMVFATVMPFSVVVFSPAVAVADLNIGLLFFLAMSSLAVYGVALGGWASNSKYSLLGSLRAVGQMVSYEVFMGLSVMGVVVLAGSFSLGEIVRAQSRMWFCIPQLPGLVIFLIAGTAESRRIPFDLPEAEAELVAGFHTEYSGLKFAFFYIGEYVGITLLSTFVVVLFFGGWLGPWLPPILWFLIKLAIVIAFLILVRAALPRLRYDQLMRFGWMVMLPLALLNLLVTGALVLAAGV
jgi:NADH-quinone oxidoreductase subunit H